MAEEEDEEQPPRSSRGWIIALALITLVLLGGVAYAAFGLESSDDAAKRAERQAAEAKAQGNAQGNAGLDATFRDPGGRFTVQYPRAWRRLASRAANAALVLTPGGQDSLLVRILDLPEPINPATVSELKPLTDQAVKVENVQILAEQPVDLNGASGFYYLYAFNDEAGTQLVHAHYFLFRGSHLHILVFQSTPDGFEKVADTFDAIANSYQPAAPTAPRPAPTTTVP